MLSIEGITVTLIVVVAVTILVRLVTGTAPQGHTVDLSVFTVAPGTGYSSASSSGSCPGFEARLLVGIGWVLARPAATSRAGRLLIADEGVQAQESAR